MFRISRRVLLAASLVLSTVAAGAAEFPTRPLHIVVPYAPGGPSDLGARIFSETLQKQLGQPVIVENRGGAGGKIGTEAALNAAPDGYTILLGAVGPLVYAPIGQKEPDRVVGKLTPLGQIWSSSQIIAARKDLPVESLTELIAYAKENPGKLNVGSAGIGTSTHMSNELLQREAGIELEHIPYTSSGPVLTDLISGQLDMMVGDASVLAPHVEAGAIKALAVTSAERSFLVPDVPSTTELGLTEVVTGNWYALFVRSDVPEDISKKLQEAVRAAQEDPAYVEQIAKHAATVGSSGAEGLSQLLETEFKRWTPVVEEAGIEFN